MKKIVFLVLMLFTICSITFASNNSETDLKTFLSDMKEYTDDFLPDLNSEKFIENVKNGKLLDKEDFFKKAINVMIKELKENSNLIFNIIIISILSAIIKNLQASSNSETSEIVFYVCYIFVITLVVASYMDIVSVCTSTINKLNNFVNALIPIILSFLIINGNIVSVGILKPILLGMTSIINIVITKIILPLNLISLVLGIVGNISNSISVSKIPKQLQKASMWCTEFLIIIFVGILSLDGTLAANVDGLTAKMAKTVVSTTIPVVRESVK